MLVCLALSDWSFVFGTVNVGRWDRKLLTSGIPGVQLSDILGTTTCVGADTPVATTKGRYYSCSAQLHTLFQKSHSPRLGHWKGPFGPKCLPVATPSAKPDISLPATGSCQAVAERFEAHLPQAPLQFTHLEDAVECEEDGHKEEGALQVLHQLLAGAPPAGVEDGQQSRHEERLGGGQGGREANWDGTPR